MKLKYLFLFLILTTPIYSQISVGISVGTDLFNYDLSNYHNYLSSYWHKGIYININGEYFLSNKISISSTIEYGYYKFDNYIPTGVQIPEIRFISAYGNNSKAIRVFGNIRFYTNPAKIFQAFISTGLGYISENLGTITATYDDMNFVQFTTEGKYQGRHYFAHTFGIGGRVKLDQNFAIDVSASYYSDYAKILSGKTEVRMVYLINNN